jgi:MFS family permease
LYPQPTHDPQDPVSFPEYIKWANVVILGLFSVMGVLLTSALNAFSQVLNESKYDDPRVNDLLLYPTLFMGIGNLIAMPIAIAVGRRPVYIFSLTLMTFSAMGCALSQSLTSHLIVRAFMSLAAGQTEALALLMVQEMNSLHVRGFRISVFLGIQVIGFAIILVATGSIVENLTWRWWYGIISILSFAILVASFFLTPETKYRYSERQDEDRGEKIYTAANKPTLNTYGAYSALTPASIMRLYKGPSHRNQALDCLRILVASLFCPDTLWLALINSISLACYVVMATTYAPVVFSPPYNFSFMHTGDCLAAQLFCALIAMPFFGKGGDLFALFVARHSKSTKRWHPKVDAIFRVLPRNSLET